MNAPEIRDREAIPQAALLYRRLLADWVKKEADGALSVSSIAFKDRRTGDVSVHWDAHVTVAQITARFPNRGLASIIAEVPRSLDHPVSWNPQPDDHSHSLIERGTHGTSRVDKNAKTMAR